MIWGGDTVLRPLEAGYQGVAVYEQAGRTFLYEIAHMTRYPTSARSVLGYADGTHTLSPHLPNTSKRARAHSRPLLAEGNGSNPLFSSGVSRAEECHDRLCLSETRVTS